MPPRKGRRAAPEQQRVVGSRCSPSYPPSLSFCIVPSSSLLGTGNRPSVMRRLPAAQPFHCERVAAAPARLSMRIFGEQTSMGERVAAELGRALQLTIILRDLRKAAERQRLYLPQELLHTHGI